jgi:hypothetical protein
MRHTLNRAMSPADFHFIAITTYLTCRVRYFRRRVYGDAPENIVKGLSEAEVQTRLGQCGYNEVREQPPDQVRAILKRLLGPIWMLEIALVLKWFCKRAARTVLTGMCYSVGSATRRGAVR